MAKSYVWVTLLVPNSGERLTGRLVTKGYSIGPLASDRVLEYNNSKYVGSILAFMIDHPDVDDDKPDAEGNKLKDHKTAQNKFSIVVRDVCAETDVMFHSVIVSAPTNGLTWYHGNLPKSDVTFGRTIKCKKNPMRNYKSLSADEQRQVDDQLVIKLLNSLSPGSAPSGTISEELDAIQQDGMLCGCASCLQGTKDKLKQKPMLAEFLLVKANELKDKVFVPDPGDLTITIGE